MWATAEAKLVLTKGELTQEGLKIIVENQRDINSNIYEALKLISETRAAAATSKRASNDAKKLHDLTEAIPGPGFPGCKG